MFRKDWQAESLRGHFILGAAPSAGLYGRTFPADDQQYATKQEQTETCAPAIRAVKNNTSSNPVVPLLASLVPPPALQPCSNNIHKSSSSAQAALLQQESLKQQTAKSVNSSVDAASTSPHCLSDLFVGIDTAPWYGCGESERLIGEAFTVLDQNATSEIRVFTKVGRVIAPRDMDTLLQTFSFQDRPNPNAVYKSGLQWGVFHQRWEHSLTQHNGFFNHERSKDFVCVHDCTFTGVETSWKQIQERLGPIASAMVHTLRLHDADAYVEEALNVDHGAVRWLLTVWDRGVSIGVNHAGVATQLLQGFLSFEKAFPHLVKPRIISNEYASSSNHSGSSSCSSVSSVMIAGCWNLMDLSAFHLLTLCERSGIAVHNAGVFASGFLWNGAHYRYQRIVEENSSVEEDGGVEEKVVTPQQQQQQQNVSFASTSSVLSNNDSLKGHSSLLRFRRKQWRDLAKKHAVSLPALALQFSLLPLSVRKVAIGCATVAELEQNRDLVLSGGMLRDDELRAVLREALELGYFAWRGAEEEGEAYVLNEAKESWMEALQWLSEILAN